MPSRHGLIPKIGANLRPRNGRVAGHVLIFDRSVGDLARTHGTAGEGQGVVGSGHVSIKGGGQRQIVALVVVVGGQIGEGQVLGVVGANSEGAWPPTVAALAASVARRA